MLCNKLIYFSHVTHAAFKRYTYAACNLYMYAYCRLQYAACILNTYADYILTHTACSTQLTSAIRMQVAYAAWNFYTLTACMRYTYAGCVCSLKFLFAYSLHALYVCSLHIDAYNLPLTTCKLCNYQKIVIKDILTIL